TATLPLVLPSTVRVNDAADPPAAPRSIVEPAATAVTTPLELIVATAVFALVYVTGARLAGTGSPFASTGVTESWNWSPGNTPLCEAFVLIVRLATMLGASAPVHPAHIRRPSNAM